VGYQEIFLIMASIVVITLIFGYFSLSKKHHQQKGINELVTE
jgi:OHS family lactose permease-like MFS transporter